MQMANEMNGTPIAPPTYSTRVVVFNKIDRIDAATRKRLDRP